MKRSSIFTKFTLLMIITTVVGVLITVLSLYYSFTYSATHPPMSYGIMQMSRAVIAQIDLNNENAAKLFLHQQSLNLRVVCNDYEWASTKDIPSLKTVQNISHGKQIFWFHGKLLTMINTGDTTYILQRIKPFEGTHFPMKIAIVWTCLMVLLFTVINFMFRLLLKPLHVLNNGVQQAGLGDFKIALPRTTNDELGELITSFNTMSQKIYNDIKSRDQLLRDISHELRSPLSRMMVALEFIPDDKIRKTLKNNILTLEKMTGSILEEERIDSPYGRIRPETAEIKTLLAEIVESKQQSGQTPVRLIGDDRFEIQVDKERIRMALSNIIDNAVKYSLKDSTPVEVRFLKKDNSVVITITDNGIGIPESAIPFIFEPFFRVDKARKQNVGYGLGMSLTKKIIDAHHGTILINSKLNSGSTFTVELPLSQQK